MTLCSKDALDQRAANIEEEMKKLEREKKELLKTKEVKNKKALELSKKLQYLKEKNNSLEKQIIETREELYKLCTHEIIEEKKYTIPGGYLDQREYVTEYYCELCGILVDKNVEYGGFN